MLIHKKIIQSILLLMFVGASGQAFAITDYVLERSFFEDKTTLMSFDDMQRQTFEPIGNMLAKGYTSSALWLRLKIKGFPNENSQDSAKTYASQHLILRIQPSYLDEIQLIDPIDLKKTHRTVGDHYPLVNNEYSSLNFNFVIPKTSEDRYIWLRLKTTSTAMMHVQALSQEDCAELDRMQEFGYAFYLAILFLLFIFPLITWISKRELLTGVFVIKQLGAMTYLFFNAGYLRLLLKNLDLVWVQFLVNLNLVAYSAITILFHYVFLSEYPLKNWARATFKTMFCLFPICLLLLIFGKDFEVLRLNMWIINALALSFLVIPIFGIKWDKNARYVFSKPWLIWIHILIFVTSELTTLPSLGYLDGNPFSPLFGMAYGGITGIIFFLVLQYRNRLSRETAIAELSSAQAHALAERTRREQQGQFLAMLTHELKTPLSILRMGLGSNQQSENTRKHIKTAIEDMTGVIDRCVIDDQLQNHSFELKVQPCNLNHLIAERISQYENVDRIQFNARHSYEIQSDEQLLRICVGNLIDNAMKYGQEDLPVEIELSESEHSQIQIIIKNKPGKAGIPDFTKIFDKYYRDPKAYEKTGSGLGLYLVKNFIEMMSGTVKAYQESGNVVFTLDFPKDPKLKL